MGTAAKWDDTTSYSRRDPMPRVPREWTWKSAAITIDVHRHIHYPETVWLVSCNALAMAPRPLKATDADDAKHEALAMVLEKLDRMAADVRKAMGE